MVITGGLWGFALFNKLPSPSPPGLVQIVFMFHMLYSFVGSLFVVRSSINFRKHWEMARKIVLDSGMSEYAVYVYPETPEGTMKTRGFFSTAQMALTVKAFFLLLFAGGAGVDAYFILALSKRTAEVLTQSGLFVCSFVVMMTCIAFAVAVYKVSSRSVMPPKHQDQNSQPK